MPALQVRDLPQETYDRLAESARREHRSLAQQTAHIIEWYLNHDGQHFHDVPRSVYAPTVDTPEEIAARKERRRLVLARIDEMGPMLVSDDMPDVVELIREGREERDARFGL